MPVGTTHVGSLMMNGKRYDFTVIVGPKLKGKRTIAIDHLNEIARPNLLRMMSWQIELEHGYFFSVGKNYKFINCYLPKRGLGNITVNLFREWL